MSIFQNFKSEAPTFEKVPEGIYLFTLVQVIFDLDSFHNWDGTPKVELPEWKNPTPQIGLLAKCDKGVVPFRLNGESYLRWDDLTEKQIASGKYVQAGNYALVKKTMMREPLDIDDPRTLGAISIVNEIMKALDMPEGSDINMLAAVVENKTPFQAKVVHVREEGFPDQVKLTRFRKASGMPETKEHSAQRLDEFE